MEKVLRDPTVLSPKPFSSIPTVPYWKNLLNRFQLGYNKNFEIHERAAKTFGDICKFNYGGRNEVVYSFDPSQWEKIFHSVSKYPPSILPPIIREVRLNNMKKNSEVALDGPFMEKEEWRRIRRVLDHKLLILNQVQKNTSKINDIGDNLVKLVKKQSQNNGYVSNLETLLSAYTCEGMATVIFGFGIGVLNDPVPEKAKNFIDTVIKYSELFGYWVFTPSWYKYFSSKYKEFEDLDLNLMFISREYVRLSEEVNKNIPSEERIDLFHYMKQEGLTDKEAICNTSGMLAAGVDTSSNAALWLLYNLGRNPEAQQKLREEINTVVGRNNPITAENLKQLKYLKFTIKESMRLTPISVNLSRTLEQPIVISGYEIPAGVPIILTTTIASRNPEYFPDPLKYNPDRFYNEDHPLQKWILLPFGTGPRVCQGFRVSELELYVLAAKLVQNFEWKCDEEVERFQKTAFIVPDRPLKIHWKPL